MRRIGDVVNLIEDLSQKDYDEYAKENNISRQLAEAEIDSKVDALTELLDFYNDYKNLVTNKELNIKFRCQYEILQWFLKLEPINTIVDSDIKIDDNVFNNKQKLGVN